MLIPIYIIIAFILSIFAILAFIIRCSIKDSLRLIHKIYFMIGFLEVLWMLFVIMMGFTKESDYFVHYILDALTYLGVSYTPVLSLLTVMVFIKTYERLPRKYYLLFILPTITNIITWTNPLHQLQYKTIGPDFSITEPVFGPWIYISGSYSYICLISGVVAMFLFALKGKNRLYLKQATFFFIGNLSPFIVSTLATTKIVAMPIWATPLSVVVTLFCQGYAIYKLHILDIRPIATKTVLQIISDGYLALSDKNLIVDFNRPFSEIFGKQYNIVENTILNDYAKIGDIENKTSLYNLLTAIDSCIKTRSSITYEQSIYLEKDQHHVRKFFIIDVNILNVNDRNVGVIVIFKDVTKLKESMIKIQDSTVRLMEQERLASLGQMVGGLAHNLKTPIMSISGSISAVDTLINECCDSLSDEEVTPEDYAEIYEEMRGWLLKVRESCSYMSDIISAVKGQAANMNASDDSCFSLDDVFRRTTLLLRHELISSGCKLSIKNITDEEIYLTGDINNLVQVVNNLISNAIDAQKKDGRRDIIATIDKNDSDLIITIKDFGTGISEETKKKMFKQMFTSKGAQGTGLGVFMSNSVMRGKFGGSMWVDNNPEGGCTFGISIPLDNVYKRKLVSKEVSE